MSSHSQAYFFPTRNGAGAVAGVPLQAKTATGKRGDWDGNGVQSIFLERLTDQSSKQDIGYEERYAG